MVKPFIVGMIPARGGSKGVPKKNIRALAGVPLLGYTIQASLRSKRIHKTIVSTDSEEIAGVASRFGGEVPFRRPEEISQDQSTDYEFIKHALDWMRAEGQRVPDYVVHLRPTTPLRDPALIDQAIEEFLSSSDATALRSAHEMAESAYKTFEVDGGYFKRVGSGSFELDAANLARQSLTKTYSANGYVDVLRTGYIDENKRIHGSKVMAFLTPRVVEVDSIEEFEFLEFQISREPKLYTRLFG